MYSKEEVVWPISPSNLSPTSALGFSQSVSEYRCGFASRIPGKFLSLPIPNRPVWWGRLVDLERLLDLDCLLDLDRLLAGERRDRKSVV